jgi:hypothetical protein
MYHERLSTCGMSRKVFPKLETYQVVSSCDYPQPSFSDCFDIGQWDEINEKKGGGWKGEGSEGLLSRAWPAGP